MPRPNQKDEGDSQHTVYKSRQPEFEKVACEDLETVDCEQILLFARSGVSKRQLMQIKKGKCPIEKCLDLHGYTVQQAEVKLASCLKDCQNCATQMLLLIHGKGLHTTQSSPVLKNALNRWLRQYQQILAFCSAQAKHGGSGALYVLLRVR